MDLVLSKLEEDAVTVFTSFQNKYLKANSRKSHLLTRSENVLHTNVGGINSVVAIDNKWIIKDHLLNIAQKINQKIPILAKIFTYIPQKKLRSTMKALATIFILSTNLDNSCRQINHKS